ncbi:fumarylacetoacetate (FAA) hydrolase [Streptomyces polygonati]|uniref:Fumarylacetoacetate (FAA) hydrolase n=1 Tax=Streptomyces polygonati TaxID=1617087 RepID=A0ABV8I3M5_9ACTN
MSAASASAPEPASVPVPPCVFECEYRGVRHAGTGLPAPGAELTLYPVAEGQLRAAVLAGGPRSLEQAVTAQGGPVTATADDPDLRFLPPLLPTDTNNSLLTGFMGTHRSKFDRPPTADEPFRAPNWLIKGMGSWTRMPGETLTVPASAVALLEEPEVALVFANDADGVPHYAGYTFGNDLNDIGLHTQNPWGWTPYAKLCDSAMTPWLFLGAPPVTAAGRVVIERGGETAWEGPFTCGADALFQRVPDMIEHLLSYPALRRPGLVQYMLLGSDKASWHDGFRIADEDRVTIEFTSHGVVLSNPVSWAKAVAPVQVG